MMSEFTDAALALEEAIFCSEHEKRIQAICSSETGYAVLPYKDVQDKSTLIEVVRP